MLERVQFCLWDNLLRFGPLFFIIAFCKKELDFLLSYCWSLEDLSHTSRPSNDHCQAFSELKMSYFIKGGKMMCYVISVKLAIEAILKVLNIFSRDFDHNQCKQIMQFILSLTVSMWCSNAGQPSFMISICSKNCQDILMDRIVPWFRLT